jgi:hypothetical protein
VAGDHYLETALRIVDADQVSVNARNAVRDPPGMGVRDQRNAHRKVRLKGLANTSNVISLFALTNLFMARKRLLAMTGAVRPKMA